MAKTTRVWDLPTRIFHWSLVILFVVSFVTAQIGGNALQWHFRSGYTILTLLVFRLIWGFVGGRYARFSSFLFSPAQIIAYAKAAPHAVRTLGHNPLGSLSVFGLIGIALLQAFTGLFANDDIAAEGPLAKFVSNATSSFMTSIHHIGEKLLIAMVLLHIGAILFYLLRKRENLIKPMLSGDREVAVGASVASSDWSGDSSTDSNSDSSRLLQASRDDAGLRWRALAIVLACAAAVAALVNWATKTVT